MYDNKMGVKRAYDYKSKYCVVKSFVVFFSGPAGLGRARRLAFTLSSAQWVQSLSEITSKYLWTFNFTSYFQRFYS